MGSNRPARNYQKKSQPRRSKSGGLAGRPIRSKRSNKKGSQSQDWLRALTLRQWHHADPVRNPTRNISHAADSLDEILEELGATSGLEEQQLIAAWQKVAGDFIAKNAKPESLKEGILVLRVVQPALKFQLEQMKGKLLQNFKQVLGDGVVKVIRLRI